MVLPVSLLAEPLLGCGNPCCWRRHFPFNNRECPLKDVPLDLQTFLLCIAACSFSVVFVVLQHNTGELLFCSFALTLSDK